MRCLSTTSTLDNTKSIHGNEAASYVSFVDSLIQITRLLLRLLFKIIGPAIHKAESRGGQIAVGYLRCSM